MFFCLQHKISSTRRLRGIVSSDGQLYFYAVDVAKLLRVADPRRHVRRNTSMKIGHVSKNELNLHPSVMNIRIMPLERAATLLEFSKSRFNVRLASQLRDQTDMALCPDHLSVDVNKPCMIYLTQKRRDPELRDSQMEYLGFFFVYLRTRCLEIYEEAERENDSD